MILRREQESALFEDHESRFRERLFQYVRANHSEKSARFDDPGLRRLIDNALARASEQYGFKAQSTLAAYVGLLFSAAPDFDRHPKIRRILTDAKFAPDDRLDVLDAYTDSKDWTEVREKADPAAWDELSGQPRRP